MAELCHDSHVNLGSEATPERLRLGHVQFIGVEGEGYRVLGYSQYDPLVMPEKLARVLRYFDGRPTEEVLENILNQEHLRVELKLIRKMVDFGILHACSSENTALPIVS